MAMTALPFLSALLCSKADCDSTTIYVVERASVNEMHSYQPSRFLLEYLEKIQLIPLSRISTSNSHILGCALARHAQPIAIAIRFNTRPIETSHKRIVHV